MSLALDIIAALLLVFAGLIVIRVALSLFHLGYGSLVFRVRRVLISITEPYLRVFRHFIPISRFSMSAPHDYSILVALIVLYVVAYVLIVI